MRTSPPAAVPPLTCRIDSDTYDFERCFPPPQDNELHRAGRQGMLDQKEDRHLSDAEWLAIQHACWRTELETYVQGAALLGHCLAHGLDPHTGLQPHARALWPRLQTSLKAEIEHCEQQRRALLDDYARYFGETAAKRFEAYVNAQCQPVAPAQQCLF
jgi:hypothetical protein